MTSMPKVRAEHSRPTNLAQVKSKNQIRQEADMPASPAIADKINHQWTDDMVDMTPVPFEGSADTDPHSELLALETTGT